MSDPIPEGEDAREAEAMGEKPDLGHRPDALIDAVNGTDSGSDTRSGSLRGGSASGSEIDPDQDVINQSLASEGMAMAASSARPPADTDPVKNTGDLTGPSGDPAEGNREGSDDDADAATG